MNLDIIMTSVVYFLFEAIIALSLYLLYKTFKDRWIKLSFYLFLISLAISLGLNIYTNFIMEHNPIERFDGNHRLMQYVGYANTIIYYISIISFFIFSFTTYRFFKKRAND